jgi:N-acetylmuramoyl-L-alanine amidase
MADWINDGGHGGADPGAVSNGNVEKVYTLEASLYVQKRLKQCGIDSDVTRTGDTTLSQSQRTGKVKKYKKALSHHFNGGGGTGVEFIHSIFADGKFEHLLLDEFKKAGYDVRPKPIYFRKGSDGSDYYYMHRETGACRTTIIEYDFVDGENAEVIKSKAHREGMYECVVRAVCRDEGVTYKPVVTHKADPQPASEGKYYRVQAGAFKSKDGAEKLQAQMKKDGYDTIIKYY